MIADRKQLFKLGVEYRELHPTKEGKRKWRYTLLRGYRVHIRGLSDRVVTYHGRDGKVWARHDKYGLYIEPGYSWNGCSPKRWIWPFGWVGTPDFRCTILASLVHDVHYQFAPTEHFPLHKSDVDLLFHDMIDKEGEDTIAIIFYTAVEHLGKWSDKPDTGVYSELG